MPGAAQAVTNPINAVAGKVLDPTITSLPGTKHDATQAAAMATFGILPTLLYNSMHGGGGDNNNPSTIPNLGINPTFYDPNSFAPRQKGYGINGDVNRLAGPAYMPRTMPGPAMPAAATPGAAPVSGAMPPASTGAGQMANIAQLIAMMKRGQNRRIG